MLTNTKINEIVYSGAQAIAMGNKYAGVKIFEDLRMAAVTHHTYGEPKVEDYRVLYHGVKTLENALQEKFGDTEIFNFSPCENVSQLAAAKIFNHIWKTYTRQTYIGFYSEAIMTK